MRFKTDRINKEFYNDLPTKNKKLYTVLMLLDNFTQLEFGKDICLTDIFRTKEEFDSLYSQTPPDKRPVTSPHMFWNAADIRSTDFNEPQIKRMLTFLNCFTYASGQGKPVSLYHCIAGNVFHFHIQAN